MIEIGRKAETENRCCAPGPSTDPGRFSGCMICGRKLVYERETRRRTCAVCGQSFESGCACEEGHFVCDACHEAASIAFFVPTLLSSGEKDPLRLFEQVIALPQAQRPGRMRV